MLSNMNTKRMVRIRIRIRMFTQCRKQHILIYFVDDLSTRNIITQVWSNVCVHDIYSLSKITYSYLYLTIKYSKIIKNKHINIVKHICANIFNCT